MGGDFSDGGSLFLAIMGGPFLGNMCSGLSLIEKLPESLCLFFLLPADTWYLPVSSRISVELLPTFTVTIYLGQSGKSLVHKSSFWIRRTLSSCLLPLSICKPHIMIICTSITLLLIGPLHESIFIYRRKYDCSVISKQEDKVKTTLMKIHAEN